MGSPARVLVIGRSGQLAAALRTARWPAGVTVEVRGRDALDLRRPGAAAEALAEGGWAMAVNAAAYTDVDGAESEPEAAFALNRDGPAALAQACARAGIPLIHVSTDYVFDGTKDGPYAEDDPVAPACVYGASKAEGEAAVRAATDRHVILRTSWLFSDSGRNFVRTMLRAGRERAELRVVDDRHGRPTAAADLAQAIVRVAAALLDGEADGFGTFHFANAGATTWHGFAREIFRQAAERGYAPVPRLAAIPSAAYPTPAPRPANSVLDTGRIGRVYGIAPRRWEEALSETLDTLLGPVGADAKARGIR